MRERWIVALVALYFAILFGGGIFVGLFMLSSLQSQITEQFSNQRPYQPLPGPGATVRVNYIPVIHNDQQRYHGDYKPYVVTVNLTAQDYRTNTTSSLNIRGFLNNTGDGTAYDGMLHIVAMNNEGIAIDTKQSFTGITAHMAVGFGVSLPYTGSALTNCTLTPLYLDRVDMLNRAPTQNGTYTP
ncbi:MAG: hypothetical protein ACM3UY_06235 [Methanocella sp.]